MWYREQNLGSNKVKRLACEFRSSDEAFTGGQATSCGFQVAVGASGWCGIRVGPAIDIHCIALRMLGKSCHFIFQSSSLIMSQGTGNPAVMCRVQVGSGRVEESCKRFYDK